MYPDEQDGTGVCGMPYVVLPVSASGTCYVFSYVFHNLKLQLIKMVYDHLTLHNIRCLVAVLPKCDVYGP